jgi:hypothetical protein
LRLHLCTRRPRQSATRLPRNWLECTRRSPGSSLGSSHDCLPMASSSIWINNHARPSARPPPLSRRDRARGTLRLRTAEKANYGQSKLFRRAAKRSARLIIRHAQPSPVVAFAEDVTEQADLPDRADELQFLYQGISARPFFGRPRAASGVMPKMEELRLTSVRSLAVRRPSGHVNDGRFANAL